MTSYAVTYNAKTMPKWPKNLRGPGGTPINSFTIREYDGQDEEVAANSAKAKGGSVNVTEELIRLCITEVNGEIVRQPYLAFDQWNGRARTFAAAAYREINGAMDEEVQDFLKAGTAEGAAPPALRDADDKRATG